MSAITQRHANEAPPWVTETLDDSGVERSTPESLKEEGRRQTLEKQQLNRIRPVEDLPPVAPETIPQDLPLSYPDSRFVEIIDRIYYHPGMDNGKRAIQDIANHHNVPYEVIRDAIDAAIAKRRGDVVAAFAQTVPKTPGEVVDLLRAAAKAFSGDPAAMHELVQGTKIVLREIKPYGRPSGTSPPIPETAPALWLKRDTRKKQTPPEFIRDTYTKWLGKGLTQAHIRRCDPSLYMALHKWLQTHDMPNWLDLPTKKVMNDRQLSDMGVLSPSTDPLRSRITSSDVRENQRLYEAARRRKPLETRLN